MPDSSDDGREPADPQACQLHGILLEHVLTWARTSSGYFPLAAAITPIPGGLSLELVPPRPPPHDYVRCDALPERGLQTSIRWAQVKSTDRAVEKIIRVYAQVSLPHEIAPSTLSASPCPSIPFPPYAILCVGERTHELLLPACATSSSR